MIYFCFKTNYDEPIDKVGQPGIAVDKILEKTGGARQKLKPIVNTAFQRARQQHHSSL